MVQQHRTFTEEFKREALNLARQSGEKPATMFHFKASAHLGRSYHVLRVSCSGF